MEIPLNVLNFFTDDKFLDIVIKNHDSVNGNVKNYYVLILNDGEDKKNYKFKYIKNYQRVLLLYPNEIFEFIRDHSINSIILHSLFSIPIDILPNIDKSIPILWIAWGYDIYELPINKPFIKLPNLYLTQTKKIQDEILKNRRGNLKNLLARFRDFLVIKNIYEPKHIKKAKKAVKRINFFSGIIDIEYQLMKRNAFFNAEESVYAYGPFDSISSLIYPTGNNILLGNSGNPTNNHIDIINILNQRLKTDSKIIAPLNYGGDKPYLQSVIDTGKQKLGSNFYPLTNFLERNEYSELINSCSSVVIGTMRQQAMGNINLAIRMGVKVFLFKDSILYKYFNSKGYKIFTIEDDLTCEALSTPLSKTDSIYNFNVHTELISKKWNPQALNKIYSQFRQYISSNVIV